MAVPWLDELEGKVNKALGELERLRAENETLQATVAELEAAAAEGSDWRQEREAVRTRVAHLVERLEKLLGGAAEG